MGRPLGAKNRPLEDKLVELQDKAGAERRRASHKDSQRMYARAMNRAVALGMLPLEYMLKVMRDPRVKNARRDQMANWAAPYCHPRLTSVEILRGLSDEQIDAALLELAPSAGITLDLEPDPGSGQFALPAPEPVALEIPALKLKPRKKVPVG